MSLSRLTLSDLTTMNPFDVTVVGGGVMGAAIFYKLSRAGLKTLLIEKGDFASATSQASSMMIWGSLPDLKHLRLRSVGKLCSTRERLLKRRKDIIRPHKFSFLPRLNANRSRISAASALYTYWLLGLGRRTRPVYTADASAFPFLNKTRFGYSYEYEEAIVAPSDARFVLDWIFRSDLQSSAALNYCEIKGGVYNHRDRFWNLELEDGIAGSEATIQTRYVINCAGAWTDSLNRSFGIKSRYKHAFGKGVFLSVPRFVGHDSTLMIETSHKEGCLALIPWGPVSLFGPTETRVESPGEGFRILPDDIRFLFNELNSHLDQKVKPEDIVSLRCGVRSLVVPASFSNAQITNGLPRDFVINSQSDVPWLTIYGGKMTSCPRIASEVLRRLKRLKPSNPTAGTNFRTDTHPAQTRYPGISEPVPTPHWSRENEMCTSLDDYLRRRTNISQWIPRCGAGRNNEHLDDLKRIAASFVNNRKQKSTDAVNLYLAQVKSRFDDIIEAAF